MDARAGRSQKKECSRRRRRSTRRTRFRTAARRALARRDRHASERPDVHRQNQIPLPPVMQPGGYYPRNDYRSPATTRTVPMAMPPLMPGAGMPGYESGAAEWRRAPAAAARLPEDDSDRRQHHQRHRLHQRHSSRDADVRQPDDDFGQKLKAGADLLFHGAAC